MKKIQRTENISRTVGTSKMTFKKSRLRRYTVLTSRYGLAEKGGSLVFDVNSRDTQGCGILQHTSEVDRTKAI